MYWKCERSGVSRRIILPSHCGAYDGYQRTMDAHRATEPDCEAGIHEIRVSAKPFKKRRPTR